MLKHIPRKGGAQQIWRVDEVNAPLLVAFLEEQGFEQRSVSLLSQRYRLEKKLDTGSWVSLSVFKNGTVYAIGSARAHANAILRRIAAHAELEPAEALERVRQELIDRDQREEQRRVDTLGAPRQVECVECGAVAEMRFGAVPGVRARHAAGEIYMCRACITRLLLVRYELEPVAEGGAAEVPASA